MIRGKWVHRVEMVGDEGWSIDFWEKILDRMNKLMVASPCVFVWEDCLPWPPCWASIELAIWWYTLDSTLEVMLVVN